KRRMVMPFRAARVETLSLRAACWLFVLYIAALAFAMTPFTVYASHESTEEGLRTRLAAMRPGQDLFAADDLIAAAPLIASFYERRRYIPVWTDRDRRAALRAAVADSATHGLLPRDYHEAALAARDVANTADAMADRELVYTDALIRLVSHLRFG